MLVQSTDLLGICISVLERRKEGKDIQRLLTNKWIFRNSGSFHNSYPIILLRIYLPLHIQFPSLRILLSLHSHTNTHLTSVFSFYCIFPIFFSIQILLILQTPQSSSLLTVPENLLLSSQPLPHLFILFCSCYHNTRLSSTDCEPLDTR